jgi:hypothetical protein
MMFLLDLEEQTLGCRGMGSSLERRVTEKDSQGDLFCRNREINRAFRRFAKKIFEFCPRSANFPLAPRELTGNSVDFSVNHLSAIT